MNTRNTGIGLLVMFLLLSTWAEAGEYSLPKKWQGKKDGASENNPLVVDGKPLWRADTLGSADLKTLDHYKTASWKASAKRWIGGGGAVIVAGDGSAVDLDARWVKKEQSHPGVGVLAFIAPAHGTYTLDAKAVAKPFTKAPNAPVEALALLKVDRANSVVTEVAVIKVIGAEQPVTAKVQLAEKDELLMVPTGVKESTGCKVHLSDLKITDGAAGAATPTPPSAE